MGNNINILVIDDEEDMCWALENILKTEDYNIVTTTSGDEALKIVKKNIIKIAFVDIKLPDIDGIELAKLIRKEDPRIDIIMISGYYYEDDGDIKKELHDGTYSTFVGKPFDNVEVRKAVQKALGLSKPR